MRTKCIICSFFRNMWDDIKKEYKKPFDWSPIIIMLVFVPIVFGIDWLWDNYAETIKLILFYSCGGLATLVFLVQVGAMVYFSCIKIRKLYLKSKEECQ